MFDPRINEIGPCLLLIATHDGRPLLMTVALALAVPAVAAQPTLTEMPASGLLSSWSPLHHVRELQNGARSALRVKPGVGARALNLHREATASLPGRLELAVESEGRLQHEGAVGAARKPANVTLRGGTALLLVGVDKHNGDDVRLRSAQH
jgi:hypothetical protein